MAVRLTPEGVELLRQASQPVQQAYETLLSPFDDAQREQFLSLLLLLNTQLDTEARASFVPMASGSDPA
jgi:DNA-binding MarR family transcriptional regulator